MYKNIQIDYENEIAIVTLNRPKKLNAIDLDTIAELDDVFRVTLPPKQPKAVILTGTGKSFTSGLDLTSPEIMNIFSPPSTQTEPGSRARDLEMLIRRMQSPILGIANFSSPVICAINGLCIGLGMDLASACDIRIASSSSRLSVREIKIGICADLGSLFFMPRICRNESWVRDICLTGRIFSAQEALEIGGFLSEVVPSDDGIMSRTMEIAREIVSNPKIAIEGTKKNLNRSIRSGMNDCFDFVAVWNSIRLQETCVIQDSIIKITDGSKISKL